MTRILDRHSYLQLGTGWKRLDAAGFGPFVTSERLLAPDGRVVQFRSRIHRLRAGTLDHSSGSTWWAPGAVVWWIGILFAIGSLCFAVGAAPGFIDLVGPQADASTFFIGSIFFTSAAFIQYLQVINTDRVAFGGEQSTRVEGPRRQRLRVVSFEPKRIDWCAVSVQLVGTLFFNYSTFHALDLSLDSTGIHRAVWFPDWLGSVCFLVASTFALLELGYGMFSWRPRESEWWVSSLNMVGSIAFGVSAVASKIVTASSEPRNQELTNLGTCVGALCFLAGAILLLPERTAAQRDQQATAASAGSTTSTASTAPGESTT